MQALTFTGDALQIFKKVAAIIHWIKGLPKRSIIWGLKNTLALVFLFPGLVRFAKRLLEYFPKLKLRFYRFHFGKRLSERVTYEDLSASARQVYHDLSETTSHQKNEA